MANDESDDDEKAEDPFFAEYDRRVKNVAEKSGHPVPAVAFCINCLNYGPYAPESVDKHISAVDLCRIFLEMAEDTFQHQAKEVLSEWGIERSEDLGRIFDAMDEEGLSIASENDSPEDFNNVFDLKQQQFAWDTATPLGKLPVDEERESKRILTVMSIIGGLLTVICIVLGLQGTGRARTMLIVLGSSFLLIPVSLRWLVGYGYRRVNNAEQTRPNQASRER